MQGPQNKSKAAAGFLSVVVPGSGHLYLGLSKQGVQLMVVFFAALFLHLPFTSILVPVIWFYALFDVLQKVDRYNQWVMAMRNRPLPEAGMPLPETAADALQDHFWFDWRLNAKLNVPLWIGVVIVLAGTYTLLVTLFPDLSNLLENWHLGSVFVALVLIGFGLRMIWSQKRGGDRG